MLLETALLPGFESGGETTADLLTTAAVLHSGGKILLIHHTRRVYTKTERERVVHVMLQSGRFLPKKTIVSST